MKSLIITISCQRRFIEIGVSAYFLDDTQPILARQILLGRCETRDELPETDGGAREDRDEGDRDAEGEDREGGNTLANTATVSKDCTRSHKRGAKHLAAQFAWVFTGTLLPENCAVRNWNSELG